MRSSLILATAGLLLSVAAADSGETVSGMWLSGDGDGWIEITLTDEGPIGRIAGSPNNPEVPRYDSLNPDEALRERPLLGVTLLQGFTSAGAGVWKNGTIYDPNSGKTYRCKLTLVASDKLKVRGYLGVALVGRTEVWTRQNKQ